jgi:cysteine-rich repeat protein
MLRPHSRVVVVVLLACACGPLVPFDETADDGNGEGTSSGGDGDASTRTVDGTDGRPATDGGETNAEVDGGEVGDEGTTGVVATCGDGIVDPGEICDDGNAEPGDGCEADCTASAGIMQWSQIVDSAADDDSARDVAVDASSDIFVVGSIAHDGNDDVWLRVLSPTGAIAGESAVDAGGDELGTSIAITTGGTYVAGVQPDQDLALLLRVDGTDLELLPGAPSDISTFTALVSPTAEGFAFVTNSGGFDQLTATLRRFNPDGQIMGDVAQPQGIYVGAAIGSSDGGTILGGGSFGGMGMGSSTWIAGLASDATTLWSSPGMFEPGINLRIRSLATAADGRIVGVGTRGEGGPMDDNDAGWIWWWNADGSAQSEGPLDIGGAAARPGAVVVGTHGLVVGGTLLAYDDGFVAGVTEDGALQWGAEVVGDAGLEDRVSSLALVPGYGVVAVGTITQFDTGEDAWIALFTE